MSDTLLSQFVSRNTTIDDDVVYGVYDNRRAGFFRRLSDSFIDRQPIALKEKAYFFHLLGVMLDAGLPILQALQVLTRRTEHQHFRRVVNTLAYQVEHGQKLSQALQRFPGVFTSAEIGIVRAGESVGNLDDMLFRLADQLERLIDLRLKVRAALTYPITVLIALVLAGGVVMTFVIPRLETFFTESNVALPALTRAFIDISKAVSSGWWMGALVLVALGLFLQIYGQTPSGRLRVDYWKLEMPIFGDLFRKSQVIQFVQLLGILTAAGVPIVHSLEILADTMKNELYKQQLGVVKEHVQQGEKIAENLAKAPFLFPDTVTQMLQIGENTASLDLTSARIAAQYDKEVDHSIKNLTTILEPLVIVLVGLAVALLAMAILGPIFSLTDLV